MVDFLKYLLDSATIKPFKLLVWIIGFCIMIYLLVKFIGIGKISKSGFECAENQKFSGYKGWYFGIEPYFRDLLGLTLYDIREETLTKETTVLKITTETTQETLKVKREQEMFEKLKKYHKAECLTYNALLKRYRIHHFFRHDVFCTGTRII